MLFGFNEPKVPSVEPEIVKNAIDTHEACIVLDVRTPGEYSRGKIAGAINIPVDDVPNLVQSVIADKAKKIYVYCLSGARSTVAVDVMIKFKYVNVFNMSHGMLGWRAKYFPVVD